MSGLFKFEGNSVAKTFEIKHLFDGKYKFDFELVFNAEEHAVRVWSRIQQQDSMVCSIGFKKIDKKTVLLDTLIFGGNEFDPSTNNTHAELVRTLFCYCIQIMLNYDMARDNSKLKIEPTYKQQVDIISGDLLLQDDRTMREILIKCKSPLNYELVFDAGNTDVSSLPPTQRFVKQSDHGKVIGKMSVFMPLLKTGSSVLTRKKVDLPDLQLNAWFFARRTIVFWKDGENWVLNRVISNLVPYPEKWDPVELNQLVVLFRKESSYSLDRFGYVDLEYRSSKNQLYLQYFYNFSTKYLTQDQITRFHRERWRGVMKQMLCAAIQLYLNDPGLFVDETTDVDLDAVPYYQGNITANQNPVLLENLRNYYTKTFGFQPAFDYSYVYGYKNHMRATISDITKHCTSDLSIYEDEVMPGQPIVEKDLKRKFSEMMSDAVDETVPTTRHPIASILPDKKTLKKLKLFIAQLFNHEKGGDVPSMQIYKDEVFRHAEIVQNRIKKKLLVAIAGDVCAKFITHDVKPDENTLMFKIWNIVVDFDFIKTIRYAHQLEDDTSSYITGKECTQTIIDALKVRPLEEKDFHTKLEDVLKLALFYYA